MFDKIFSSQTLEEAWEILITEFPLAIWETVYVTIIATLFAVIIGLPLGVLLVAGEKNGVLPLPKGLMHVLNVIINLLRAVSHPDDNGLSAHAGNCRHFGRHGGIHRTARHCGVSVCCPPC